MPRETNLPLQPLLLNLATSTERIRQGVIRLVTRVNNTR